MSLNEGVFPHSNKEAEVCPIYEKVTRRNVKTIVQS